jgi:hypothetical protein
METNNVDNNIEYTSQKEPLIIAEYGRNIQKLVQHCKGIEDKEERQRFAEAIVKLMSQIVPQQHTKTDYNDKLWKHFFRLAEFDIDVTPPSGEMPVATKTIIEPQQVSYPTRNRTHRHYGIQIKDLIKKAIEMEDGEKKTEFVKIIGSFMKMAYKNWNREHYVSDEIIMGDLMSISEGKLKIDENVSLDGLMSSVRHRSKKNSKSNSKKKKYTSKKKKNYRRY